MGSTDAGEAPVAASVLEASARTASLTVAMAVSLTARLSSVAAASLVSLGASAVRAATGLASSVEASKTCARVDSIPEGSAPGCSAVDLSCSDNIQLLPQGETYPARRRSTLEDSR